MLRTCVDLLRTAEEALVRANEVGVGVGSARDFPRPDEIGVGLLGRGVTELDQVRLGLEHEDRNLQVGPDPRGVAALDRDRTSVDRGGGPATAVNEDAIEGIAQRLDGVGVGRQVDGGL